ncbi:MAG: acyl-CoA desaturase [Flavobacteriales bacterium]|nr:acyl-CoA desaturase [Flavobacteriales bacterium]
MIVKTISILFVFCLTYGLILSNVFVSSAWIILVLCAIHGFYTAQIGLNIGHDAVHGAFSSKIKVNKRMAMIFNIVGANDYVWSITHNILHHTFTNIPDHDDDLNQPAILRVSPDKKLMKIHRFQHIYVFFLYTLSSLSWVFVKDYVKFFSKNLGAEKNKVHPRKEYFRLFFYKAVYYTILLVIPMLVVDFAWYYILLGFYVAHVFEGLTLALVFHMAHLVEGTDFPVPTETGSVENSWAIHQMYTTADFSRKSPIANWLCGGLNFQVEHHLFPLICHVHYKHISPIVKQTAEEFGVPFIENKTFAGAIASHLRLLKRLGRQKQEENYINFVPQQI